MKSFFKEAINNIKTTGSIKPSSKHLINDCLKYLNFTENQVVLEFGPGDGCITNELLNRMPASAKLISFEINEKFYNHCTKRFKNHSNFQLENHSALNFHEVLKKEDIKKVDFIVSSLPLTLFKEEELITFFDQIPKFLKKESCYVQYQYSLLNYRMLKRKFTKVNIDFTLRNTPPAFVYKCVI